MLDNLKFAQYVNEERKKLIKSTRERGVYVADNAQLSEVVARNSEIQPYQATSTDKVSVTFLDADGTLLKREYLDIGGTATAPSNPTLDSDYLTFSGWSDTELTNITESKTIYATYTTKDNATYIFIHIPTANKAITLNFGGTITSVDWGDGTTNATLSHTYSTIGDYIIKVIGGTSISGQILGSNYNNYCVLKCYVSNTITSLEGNSFYYCYSLYSIILPNSITSIGQNAFYYCYSLTTIILPNSITSIGSSAFYLCHSLKNIYLPRSVTGFSGSIFAGCTSLTSINLPSGAKSLGSTFSGCHSLTSITLPNTITDLNSAFYGCYSLTNITLPNSITSIGSETFRDCSSLTSITIPEGVTYIGDQPFDRCYSLTSITIPEGVTYIGNYAFEDCNSLTSITLPNSITSIGQSAFYKCYNLQQVVINAEKVIPLPSNTFSSDAYNTKIYVPDNLVEDYKVATNWVKFADRIYPLSSLGE